MTLIEQSKRELWTFQELHESSKNDIQREQDKIKNAQQELQKLGLLDSQPQIQQGPVKDGAGI